MENITIKTFEELLEALERQKTGQNFVYRGVSKNTYDLVTSLGRSESSLDKSIERLESRLIRLFKESSIPYLEHKPNNELEWLAVAQHYGLPTRLLDWSYNPLIAIYFAVETNVDDDGAVYKLSGCSTIQKPDETDPYTLKKVYKYRPPYISARIQNQAGLFTVHHKPDEAFVHDKMMKVTIPKKLKATIKKTLFKYGVNQRLMYPGLEGVARDLKWLETKMH